MPIRDVAITLFVLSLLPFAVRRPWIGAVAYGWISIMNPHKLTWGFAYNMPFAQLIAAATILGLVFSPDDKRLPGKSPVVALVVFYLWMCLTTMTAIDLSSSVDIWAQVTKNFLMIVVALMVVKSRTHVDYLAWALVIAIGYFSFKGGIFTAITGGSSRVWGPPGGKIQENNALAVAVIMVIPLMRWLQLHTETRWFNARNKWVRRGLMVLMFLSVLSALGSQSRGAFLALSVMAAIFWWKSKRKILIGLGIAVVASAGLLVMSEKWEARMQTIKTYEEDQSAMSRLFAWETMYNLAKDRPMVGGGFETATSQVYQSYTPDPSSPWVVVAHSIYFATLGQHGFVGLSLFLLLWFVTWRAASRIIVMSRAVPDLLWAGDLARMCHVSLIAYLIGGAFLDLQYFELPYYLMVALVATLGVVEKRVVTTKGRSVLMDGRPDSRRPGAAGAV